MNLLNLKLRLMGSFIGFIVGVYSLLYGSKAIIVKTWLGLILFIGWYLLIVFLTIGNTYFMLRDAKIYGNMRRSNRTGTKNES